MSKAERLANALVEQAEHHFQVAQDCDMRPCDTLNWTHFETNKQAAAELRRLSAELAALKAAMGEPVAWTTGINWHPVAHYQSEQVQKLTRKEQPEHGFIVALYAIPKDKP